jgi:hypothetical protein
LAAARRAARRRGARQAHAAGAHAGTAQAQAAAPAAEAVDGGQARQVALEVAPGELASTPTGL